MLPRLQLLAAALLFSTGGAAIKLCGLSSWQVAGFRSGAAAVVLAVLTPASPRHWTLRTLPVAVAYAATLILFVIGNKLTTAANTIFLQSTAPLYVLLLGPWLLREPVSRRDLAFMAFLAAGLALFFVDAGPSFASAPDPWRGNVAGALSGVSWASTVVGIRWIGSSEPAGAITAIAAGNLLTLLICLPAALPVIGAHPADWALVLYLGAFQVALPYVLMSNGLRHVPALEASLLLLLEPVLNPVWAWLVHGEEPGALALTGGAIILAATVIKTLADSRMRPRPRLRPP
jgi:DME family drug/metabolite transporter